MADSNEGRRLHKLAENTRESGQFLKALEYTDQATLAYQKDGDPLGLAEVQSSRQSTFKHLYRATKDKIYLVLEKHAALSAVEIAEKCGKDEALGIPYHNLGKYYFEAKKYRPAIKCFQKAIDNLSSHSPSRHSRASVIADIKGHQYSAEYHLGDKAALARALQTLEELENSQEDSSFNKNVWITGAHLRIAEMLAKDNPPLAQKHLREAEKIISSDSRLILRKHQLDHLRVKPAST